MIRMRALRNLPVVCGEKQLGLLQNLCLDEAQRKVRALIISCGLRGKQVVLSENVLAVCRRFILVRQAERYHRSFADQSCLYVRDASGLLLGRIVDFAVDEMTLSVVALNMRIGYRFLGARASYWLFDYHRDDEVVSEVRVPTAMSVELIGMKEEWDSCDFLP